jgi:hypothetical protein
MLRFDGLQNTGCVESPSQSVLFSPTTFELREDSIFSNSVSVCKAGTAVFAFSEREKWLIAGRDDRAVARDLGFEVTEAVPLLAGV